jgi:cell division protein FtsB
MPRAAAALATSESRSAGASARATGFRLRRLHLVLMLIAVVGVWLVFVFARALGDVDRATARQAQIDSEAVTLQQRLDADHRELLLVQTDAFQRLQARAYGMGAPGEVVFSLPQDAPPAVPISPLGGGQTVATSADPATPLDAWLKILFGN